MDLQSPIELQLRSHRIKIFSIRCPCSIFNAGNSSLKNAAQYEHKPSNSIPQPISFNKKQQTSDEQKKYSRRDYLIPMYIISSYLPTYLSPTNPTDPNPHEQNADRANPIRVLSSSSSHNQPCPPTPCPEIYVCMRKHDSATNAFRPRTRAPVCHQSILYHCV